MAGRQRSSGRVPREVAGQRHTVELAIRQPRALRPATVLVPAPPSPLDRPTAGSRPLDHWLIVRLSAVPSALLRLHHRQPFNPASVIANPKKNNGRPMNTRRMLNISMKPVIQIAEPTPTKMTRTKKSGTITPERGSWRTPQPRLTHHGTLLRARLETAAGS